MQTLKTLVSEIRNVTGCQGCSFYQDTEDESRFILREKWANQEALDKHLRSHRYKVLVGAINLLSKKSDINYYTTESSEANEARNDEDEN
jgi:quinol monooxygenase YgiN